LPLTEGCTASDEASVKRETSSAQAAFIEAHAGSEQENEATVSREGIMQLPLQISTRGVELGSATEALIRQHAEKLDRYYDRIVGMRVMVEVSQRQMGEPITHDVRIDLTVPGGEVVVTHQAHPELRTAIQRGFDAARRRLQDYARRQRGDVKAHAE
jgi:ribosome-associated translation inhibitor RaiA